MAATLSSLLLLILSFVWNSVKSQFNDTNTTDIPFMNTTWMSTQLYTTIDPTADPTLDPTTDPTTSDPTTAYPTTHFPTYDPTEEGCSALHGYVETNYDPEEKEYKKTQISSYPVSFGPFSYRVDEVPLYHSGQGPNDDPCNTDDTSIFNRTLIDDKVIILDGHLGANCNFQQWTLNVQDFGAKGVLIAVRKPFSAYAGDDSLSTPRIPTRLIDYDASYLLYSPFSLQGLPVTVTLDCFDNDYPAEICIEDINYGKDDYYRINGNYEQQVEEDENGHPIWIQDSTYNFGSSIDWKLQFDTDTYFNWVITSDSSTGIIAYCNDSNHENPSPSNCSTWYEKPINSPFQFVKSDTLLVFEDICPAPIDDSNTTNYCIKSNSALNGNTASDDDFTGTYQQLIEGIPEWFYENDDGDVAILYWAEIHLAGFNADINYGWRINVEATTKATCIFSKNDTSIDNPAIRYYPNLCTQWLDTNLDVDDSFDIDNNICENDIIDSDVTLICVIQNENDGYSSWSGSYSLNSENVTIGYHRIWTFMFDDNEYVLFYYEVGDGWCIAQNIDIDDVIDSDQVLVVDDDDIIAICNDKKGLSSNPIQCSSNNWILKDGYNQTEISFTIIQSKDECDAPIITTQTPITSNDDDPGGEAARNPLEDFSVGEYVAIGAALLAFPLCIVCFVCYQRRKEKRKNTDNDDGISLQPYVPTGMAYDSYKQNQSHKEKKRTSTKIKKPGPKAAVGSVGSTDDGEEPEINSRNALINVYDEDDGGHQLTPIGDDDGDDENPFLTDDVIKTGQTLQDDGEGLLNKDEVMSAFDEL